MPFTQRRFSRRRNRQLNKVRSQRKKKSKGSRKQRRVRRRVRGGASLWSTEQDKSIRVSDGNKCLTINSTSDEYIPCFLENQEITSSNSTITFQVNEFWDNNTGIRIGVSDESNDKYWCVNLITGYKSFIVNNKQCLQETDRHWIQGTNGSETERQFTIDTTTGIMMVKYRDPTARQCMRKKQWNLPDFNTEQSFLWRIEIKSSVFVGSLKIIA